MSKNKKIVILVIIVALVGLLGLCWFYQDVFFGKLPKREQPYKVAVVLLGGAYQEAVDGLIDEFENLGYEGGKDILYYIKDTQGDKEAIVLAAEELLEKNPDVFYTVSTPVTTRIREVVGDQMPIVFNIVGDPIGANFAKSFSSSETNLTGCSNLSAGLSGKRLEILKEAFPILKKVVTFYDPENKFSQLSIANTREAASKLGVEVVEVNIDSIDDLNKALTDLKPGQYDAIYLTPDAMVISKVDLVVERAKELALPIMGHVESLAEKGVTITYGANFYKLGVQCASTIYRILKGQEPQNIPIQAPREVDTVVNLRAVQEMGLTISPEILGRANRIIR